MISHLDDTIGIIESIYGNNVETETATANILNFIDDARVINVHLMKGRLTRDDISKLGDLARLTKSIGEVYIS